jgi:hypothetical protein
MRPTDDMDAVEKRGTLPLQGIEPQLCGLPAGSLVTMSTEPYFCMEQDIL